MDEFGGLFWNVFLRGLLLALVDECVVFAFVCLLLMWMFVLLRFFLEFGKWFCLQILSGWAAGQEKKVVLERVWGR